MKFQDKLKQMPNKNKCILIGNLLSSFLALVFLSIYYFKLLLGYNDYTPFQYAGYFFMSVMLLFQGLSSLFAQPRKGIDKVAAILSFAASGFAFFVFIY